MEHVNSTMQNMHVDPRPDGEVREGEVSKKKNLKEGLGMTQTRKRSIVRRNLVGRNVEEMS